MNFFITILAIDVLCFTYVMYRPSTKNLIKVWQNFEFWKKKTFNLDLVN